MDKKTIEQRLTLLGLTALVIGLTYLLTDSKVVIIEVGALAGLIGERPKK